jgi:hypothetical protein
LKQHVDVIGHAAADQRLATEIVGGPAQDIKQFVAPFAGQHWLAVLCGKDYVQVDFCE